MSATESRATPLKAFIRMADQVTAFRRELNRGRSATELLQRWCARHEMGEGCSIRADKIAIRSVFPDADQARLLRVSPAEKLEFRDVDLRCGRYKLSHARLWYVRSRLPDEIHAQLISSDLPFGEAVAPLQPRRTSLLSVCFWPGSGSAVQGPVPEIFLRQVARLTLPENLPVALAIEDYRCDLLKLDSDRLV